MSAVSLDSGGGTLETEYALRIIGNELEPDLPGGCLAVFDPTAGPPLAKEIAAVWLHGVEQPSVVRLVFAVPPLGPCPDFDPVLVAYIANGKTGVISMSKVRHVHRFVRIAIADDCRAVERH